MAWTTPRTWSAGAAVAAADLNVDLRDNTKELYDRLVAHGITSTTPQAVKSAGYGVSLTRSSQNIADATDVAIAFDTEEWDDAAFHSTSVNTSRVTIPTGGDGRYEFTAWVSFEANSSGRREAWIEKNGATEYNRVRLPPVSTATGFTLSVELDLDASDYVVLRVRQSSGSTLTAEARLQARRTAV